MPTPLAINLLLNGDLKTVSVAADTEPLLYVLRNQLKQVGPKFGCGVAQCGVCTVGISRSAGASMHAADVSWSR